MKRMKLLAVFAVIVLLCSEAYAFTASYEQTISGAGVSQAHQVKVIKIKDNKIRMEMDTPQGKTITIIDGGTMYSYIPSKNSAIKMKSPISPELEVLSDYTAYLESLGAKFIGSERVGPYDCDIYEFTDPRINVLSKVWLWKAKEFPCRRRWRPKRIYPSVHKRKG